MQIPVCIQHQSIIIFFIFATAAAGHENMVHCNMRNKNQEYKKRVVLCFFRRQTAFINVGRILLSMVYEKKKVTCSEKILLLVHTLFKNTETRTKLISLFL